MSECVDELNPTLSRLQGTKLVAIARGGDVFALYGAAAGRLLTRAKSGSLAVLDSTGAKLATLAYGRLDVLAARIDARQVLVRTARSLDVYAAASGRLRKRLPPLGRRVRLLDLDGGLVVYLLATKLHVLRLADGKDVALHTATRLFDADLEPSGLFYAQNDPARVTFVPRAAVLRALP